MASRASIYQNYLLPELCFMQLVVPVRTQFLLVLTFGFGWILPRTGDCLVSILVSHGRQDSNRPCATAWLGRWFCACVGLRWKVLYEMEDLPGQLFSCSPSCALWRSHLDRELPECLFHTWCLSQPAPIFVCVVSKEGCTVKYALGS